MKRSLILVTSLLFISVHLLFAQTWPIQWEKKYPDFSTSYFSDLIADKNGGFTILGKITGEKSEKAGFWLVRMAETGDTLKTFFYAAPSSVMPKRLTQAVDGSYLMMGEQNPGQPDSELILLMADETGVEKWRKNYPSGVKNAAKDLIALNDGSFVVAGSKGIAENLSNLWVLCIGPDGGLIWEKTFGGTNQSEAGSIKQLPDGSLAIAGKIWKTGTKDSDAWILRTTSKGDTIWTSRVRTPGLVVWPECICCTPDSLLMVLGWQGTCMNDINSEEPIFDYDLILYKLDKKGKLILKKNVDSEGSEGGNNIAARPDGTFILAGKKETSFAGRIGPWLLHIDRDGKILSENLLKFHYINDQAARIINTPDGGCIVIGPGIMEDTRQRSYAWAIKLNPQ